MSHDAISGITAIRGFVQGLIRYFVQGLPSSNRSANLDDSDDWDSELDEFLIAVVDHHLEILKYTEEELVVELGRLAVVFESSVDEIKEQYQRLLANDEALKKAREKKDENSWVVTAYFTLREKVVEIAQTCQGPDPHKELVDRYHAWIVKIGDEAERAEKEERVRERMKKSVTD
ncbi:hypothetical protein MMC22_000380 [Lobaria immixta]|nr:hypothetical protein [Lobaria immixta]